MSNLAQQLAQKLKRKFTPANWYWSVAGNPAQVFSSVLRDYVSVADGVYQSWLAAGNAPTPVSSEDELGAVLAQHDIMPVPSAVANAYKDKQVDRLPLRLIFKLFFNLENRVRALEGQPSVTQNQYKNALKSLVD